MLILEGLPKETARDYVLRVLKENIINLELPPGSKISENDLAAELGRSRTPVREALIELNKYCLVDIYPQRGSFVALIDYDLVDEARFLRLVLEKSVGEMACDLIDEEGLTQLEENIHLQEFYAGKNSHTKIMELDNAFHHFFYRICKKEQIYIMMQNFTVHFDRVRHLSFSSSSTTDANIIADHRAILEALRARDKALLQERIQHHLTRYKIDRDQISSKYGDYIKK